MASVQETLTRGLRQLGNLNVSQRVAIALGLVLVVGSLGSLIWWAATPEMTPLLSQSLSAEDVALVTSGLDALGVKYQVNGSQVLVPGSVNRAAIYAQLQQAEKFPTDTSVGFAELVRESNPWISQKENERRWTVAVKTELERVLGQFAGIRRASVFLNLNSPRSGFSREAPESKASVTLFMSGGEAVPRKVALAAARLVSGAVRGLPLRSVEVVDGNGGSPLDWDDEGTGEAAGLHRLQKQKENELVSKLRNVLGYDPGIRIEANVILDHRRHGATDTTVSEGTLVERQTSNTETKRGVTADQPGVQANVGQSVSTGGTQDTSKTTTSDEQHQPSVATTHEDTLPGEVMRASAAINVSYGYLLSIFRRQNPESTDTPTEPQIQAIFDGQKSRFVQLAQKLVLPPEPEQVAVDWYYDAPSAAPPAEAGTLDMSFDLAQRYGPAAGLSTLAMVSLMLMLRMARKSDSGEGFGIELGLPEEAIEAAKQAAQDIGTVRASRAASRGGRLGPDGVITLDPNDPTAVDYPVGFASEATLEGQEVDESIVKVSNMIQQIASIVERDEDGVSNILERMIKERRR